MDNYILKDGTLYHHGILGQRWGIRRYQNEDGTLTEEGKARLRKRVSYETEFGKQDGFIKKGTKKNTTIVLSSKNLRGGDYKKAVKESLNSKTISLYEPHPVESIQDDVQFYETEGLANPYTIYSRDFVFKNDTKIAAGKAFFNAVIDNIESDDNKSVEKLLKDKGNLFWELSRKYSDNRDKINEQLIKEGYDAIYNPMQDDEEEQQVIFINPKKTFEKATNVKYGEEIVKDLLKKGYKKSWGEEYDYDD